MRAAVQNCGDSVTLLCRAGADVDLQDDDGRTALMYAAEHGAARVVAALLNARARTGGQIIIAKRRWRSQNGNRVSGGTRVFLRAPRLEARQRQIIALLTAPHTNPAR